MSAILLPGNSRSHYNEIVLIIRSQTRNGRLQVPLPPFPVGPARLVRAKSGSSEAPPQLGAVVLSGRPLGVEPGQIELERTLPDAKDVGALATQHPADQIVAVPGAAHDLLDRDEEVGPPKSNDALEVAAVAQLVLIEARGGDWLDDTPNGCDKSPIERPNIRDIEAGKFICVPPCQEKRDRLADLGINVHANQAFMAAIWCFSGWLGRAKRRAQVPCPTGMSASERR
jgi:hypothetical protein